MIPTSRGHASFATCLLCALATYAVLPVRGVPTTIDGFSTKDLEPAVDLEIPEALRKFPDGPLNTFLKIISALPEGEAALDATAKILTPLQQILADAVDIDTTEDGLAQDSTCADITVIFARGTTEPGNVGLVTGPPFFDALTEQLGSRTLVVQGVEYAASFAGFNKNGSDGVPSMTSFINQTIAECPNSSVVMSGYSQGALVLRSTAESLPAETMSRISSVVTFGDPGNPDPITGAEGKTMIICDQDDAVCSGGFINIAHLTYADNATMAAEFVIQKVGDE